MAIQPVFEALADPTRRAIIEMIVDHGPQTATQLAAKLPMTRQGVTRHLTSLADAGLVTVQQRYRNKHYSLTLQPLAETFTWVMAVQVKWDARLQALHDFLMEEDDEDSAGI